jgi:hypothetical protein
LIHDGQGISIPLYEVFLEQVLNHIIFLARVNKFLW